MQERTEGCLSCRHRDRHDIENDLAIGLYTIAGAAAAYGLPTPDLRRHTEICGAPVMAEDGEPIDSPEAVTRAILATDHQLVDIIEGAGDRPGTKIRAIAERTRILELRAKVTNATPQPGVHVAVAEGDGAQALAVGGVEWARVLGALNSQLDSHPEARAVMAEALAVLDPQEDGS